MEEKENDSTIIMMSDGISDLQSQKITKKRKRSSIVESAAHIKKKICNDKSKTSQPTIQSTLSSVTSPPDSTSNLSKYQKRKKTAEENQKKDSDPNFRWCHNCGRRKSIQEFPFKLQRKKDPTSTEERLHRCENCARCYVRTNQIRRKRLVEARSCGCVDCGETRERVLQSDHVRGIKRDHVSQIASLELLENELSKTVTRCANCHRIKTYQEKKLARKKDEDLTLSYRNWRAKKDVLYKWINEMKSTEGCVICKNQDFRCLDFDHVDPSTKNFAISSIMFRSLPDKKAIEEELKKCQVLCANCHMIRTYEQSKIKWR